MLRHLRRLTGPVEAAGPQACAIAVYADATARTFPAADLGYEGVACVDDAARAAILLGDVWEATGSASLRGWATGLLDFVHYMQLDDGRFVNFITGWDGARNMTGPTSFPGGGFWQARGMRALAKAWLVFDDERARRGLLRGLAFVRGERDVPPDIRSIHAMTAMDLLRAGRMPELRADLERWCDEIAALRRGAVLLDNPDESEPHLWGHVQEGVLADAGAFLGRPDLVAIARASALAYLAPLIASGFDAPTVQPYGVASAIHCVDRLAAATGEPLFADLAAQARAWFDGRNPSGRPVYDRQQGRVHDGVDDGVLNPHSGAESNIVAAQALLDDVIRLAAPAARTA
ncbi:MAG TPA: hypothetical protein VFM06_06385 [Candidatus Limnocylindria bacterium]|nr:hypothetical protein [Candidatus Limnocylindria bacterium]